MAKYKTLLCAMLVAASIGGTTHVLIAAASNERANLSLSQQQVSVSEEALVPKKIVKIPYEADLLKVSYSRKIMLVKDVQAHRVQEEARIAKEKREAEAKIAAAKKVEEAKKLAAKKAEQAKLAAAKKTTKKIVASRSGSSAPANIEKATTIIAYAKEYLGVKYSFGGTTPKGFDCSGFTMYVFKEFGIKLPHTARGQAELGVEVKKSELKPGDLVFFHTYTSGISHVGIYVGNGNFIEASSSRGIAITSLNSSYYKDRYLGATRIIK